MERLRVAVDGLVGLDPAVGAQNAAAWITTVCRVDRTGAQRRAIEVRDLECSHPFCDRPAA